MHYALLRTEMMELNLAARHGNRTWDIVRRTGREQIEDTYIYILLPLCCEWESSIKPAKCSNEPHAKGA